MNESPKRYKFNNFAFRSGFSSEKLFLKQDLKLIECSINNKNKHLF